MKILQVNKFFFPNSGADKYFLELSAQLIKNGHQVRFFAMDDNRNLPCSDKKYFVSNISLDKPSLKDKIKAIGRIIYSFEAKKKFRALLEDFHPDIIHIHNIYHQISPSILTVARQAKIPVIMHLHDYKLICPNYKLFTNNQACYRCRPKKYYQCLYHRCLDDSVIKSLIVTIEMYVHHNILKIYEKGVSLFIAPSQSMAKTVESFGWPKEKIKYLQNFFSLPNNQEELKEQIMSHKKNPEYLLYFGRLAPEKGLETLLQAIKISGNKLKIVGRGPSENLLKNLSAKLQTDEQVEFLGYKQDKELLNLIINAQAIIIPSIWLENMPLNALESLALGKIVIAANIGGLPEIIQDGKNGFLFEPGQANELAHKIKQINNCNQLSISQAAIKTVADLTVGKHTEEMEKIYQKLIKQN